MWTLDDVRTKLADRLAEESTVFWAEAERDSYINEAQRFIAAVTKGVPGAISVTATSAGAPLALPAKVVGLIENALYTEDGRRLAVIHRDLANRQDPAWASRSGTPRWVVFNPEDETFRVAPTPSADTDVTGVAAVLPDDLAAGSDELFSGVSTMEKYQGALLNYAAYLALLKERYDQDAERFYQLVQAELQSLGVTPNDIPPVQEVNDVVRS